MFVDKHPVSQQPVTDPQCFLGDDKHCQGSDILAMFSGTPAPVNRNAEFGERQKWGVVWCGVVWCGGVRGTEIAAVWKILDLKAIYSVLSCSLSTYLFVFGLFCFLSLSKQGSKGSF